MVFRIASSPFIHNRQNTPRIMLWVILATVPGIAAQVWFFSYGTLLQIFIAITTALLAEGCVMALRRKPIYATLCDNSAVLTALLLGVSLPPLAPWWMVVLGTLFAIIIAKQLYGGLGQNPFNPAMIGYVVLLISFPVPMTSWLAPRELLAEPLNFTDTLAIIFNNHTPANYDLLLGTDGITQATPLDNLKTSLHTGNHVADILRQPIYQGTLAGLGWQWVNLGFLFGGLLLLLRRVIHWQIPVSFLLTLTLCSLLGEYFAPQQSPPPLLELFSGATMLGAFFIATDPVTASTTPRGRFIFGALCGALLWLIRHYGGYPDGVAFAVLLANITVPLIDYYTQPRIYGYHRGK